MRLLPRVPIIFVVCLMAIALTATPAQAICGGPTIDLSPSSGAPGTEVAVYGQRFDAGSYIDILYEGTIVATGRTGIRGTFTITFTVPECHMGAYEVLAGAYTKTAKAYFYTRPGLTVTPEKGPVDTTVTLQGQGFASNQRGIELRYYIDHRYTTIEANIRANAKGSWETTFQIPESSKGEHKIDAQYTDSNLYQVEYAIFEVTPDINIDKSSATVGDTITITASRFAASERDIKVLFAGQEVVTDITADSEGEWEASFEVPEMPAGEYSITIEGQRTNKEDIGELSFEVEPGIVLSPDQGHVGMDLTVTGCGFNASEDINIMYEDSQVTTVTGNDKGSFNVSFAVPESRHGERLVTAGYGAGNAASAIFTMESEPPDPPTPVSPVNRSRVGLIGKVTPTFEWSEVSDDSGVRYRLQIATSANVTTSSVIVSITDLTETSYTLEEKEALPDGIYYWTVQAVDGAENESGWAIACSFRVGLLPRWGFIASVAAAVVLLVILIRALVRRRSIYYDRW
ncbi:MAG: IPT/TIG domain-containing protein [Chloroflexota bacterium]